MSKEQQKSSDAAKAPEKLSPQDIKKIVSKYENVKLDKGAQHFMLEHYGENGQWVRTDLIPTWAAIPRENGSNIDVEEELKNAGGKLKNNEPIN